MLDILGTAVPDNGELALGGWLRKLNLMVDAVGFLMQVIFDWDQVSKHGVEDRRWRRYRVVGQAVRPFLHRILQDSVCSGLRRDAHPSTRPEVGLC